MATISSTIIERCYEMKSKKILSLIVTTIVVFSLAGMIPTMFVQGVSGNDVTINDPTGTTEVLFYNKLTVNFTVTKGDPPWIYTGTTIYLDNLAVDSTSEGLGSPFVKTYYPEGYAGAHFVRVEAHFVKGWQDTEDKSDTAGYIVKNANDTTDLEDLRIDKLHDYEVDKGYLDGSGVTICILDDILGCHENYSDFHKSLYRSCYNDLYQDPDRKYIDIQYLKEFDGDFYEDWNETTDTNQEKWEEIFEEGKDDYQFDTDVHGTYCLATLRQIAPAATYIFLETLGSQQKAEDAIIWLQEDRNDSSYDYKAPYDFFEIDIISMSWTNTYPYMDFEEQFEVLSEAGVVSVGAAGQYGLEGTEEGAIFYYDYLAKFPCSYDSVIGVTGVTDGTTILGSGDRWERDTRANTGWGVEIAALFMGTILDWSPVPDYPEFGGTSNSCPLVAGILALLEQYQNNYKTNTDLNVTLIQTLFEKTGDEPGSPPSSNTTEIGGYIDWINDNNTYYLDFPYHDNATYAIYDCGWGIIDGYEMFKYIKLYY